MINKRYSKKESKGLPGGPHEQFTYVTGVFMQDMYHVPKAQDGFESLTQNSFNLMDSNPNYFASDEELVRKEEQKRREWNIRRQMMLEDEYKNLDKDPRSIAFQKNIQQLKNERIEDRIKKSKEEQKNRPKYKPNKAYDLNAGTWDIQHPKSYYRDNWDRLNPETKKRELTYHIDDFLKYTPDDLKKYKKLRAKGRDYENEKDATEENILFLRKMDAKLDAQENIGDKIKRGRPTSKQMQKLVLDWADKYDAGYNNQYNTAAELTVPFGASSFMMDDQSEYNEQMRGYDVNNLSEQEKQWEKERLESVLKQQSLDIDFRYGGNIPKAQKGFEQPILYVDSEDDERNQLYQDSFQLYNASLAQKKIFGNGPWVPGVGTVDKTDIKGDLPENSSFSQTEAEYDRRNRLNNKTSKYLKNKELIKKYKNLGFTDDTIKYYDTIPEVFNPLINPTSAYLPTPTTPRFVYQKPHTKVVVRPSINSKTPVVQKKEPSYRVHDFFKHHGMDPSYKSRSEAAKAYGIDNYGGTEEQNKKLIELMLPNYPLDKKLMPRAQKGGDFQRLVKKYTTKGWSSLTEEEKKFYRDNYNTTILNKFTLDENNTLYGTLPTVNVTAPHYKGKGEDITKKSVLNDLGTVGTQLAKDVYEMTGIPAAKRIYNDFWSYPNAVKGFGKAVVNRAISPFPYHVSTPEEMVVGDKMGDLLEVTPGVGLLGKGAKTAGRALTTGPLKNTYKYNPFSNKLNEYNRIVAQDAVQDAMQTNLIRTGKPKDYKKGPGINLDRRGATAFPSFGKKGEGLDDLEVYYNDILKKGNTPYIISTDRPMKVSTLGRHGKGSTMFPVDESGNYLKQFPLSEANIYNYQPHWLKGYQNTKQQGGEFQKLVNKYTTQGWASLNPQEQQFYRETYQKGGEGKDDYKNYVYPLGDNTYKATPYSLPVAEVWGNPINTGRQLTKTIGKGVTNLGKNVLEGLAIPEALVAYGIDKYRGKNTELADVFPSMFSDIADRQHKGQPDVVTSVTSDDWVRENPGKALAAGFLMPGFAFGKASKASSFMPRISKKPQLKDYWGKIAEDADNIKNYREQLVKDLTSDEGIKRLKEQEYSWAKREFPEKNEIQLRDFAEQAAFARINDMHNMKSFNELVKSGKRDKHRALFEAFKPDFENAHFTHNAEIRKDKYSYAIPEEDLMKNINYFSPSSTAYSPYYFDYNPVKAHEYGHAFQYGRTLPVDDELRKLIKPKAGLNMTKADYYPALRNLKKYPIKYLQANFNRLFRNKQFKDYDYFARGSGGKESSAFAHELRQVMIDRGILKSRYDEVTPEKLKLMQKSKKINPGDKTEETRMLDFMQNTESNYKNLSKIMNKLPVFFPAAIGLSALEKEKKGGQFNVGDEVDYETMLKLKKLGYEF